MNSNITVINPIRIEEQEDKIRVAAYCRVSTDSEDQQNSLMAQMRYYENFLSDSETERLVSVYADMKIAYLIQRAGRDYLKKHKNKGFRRIECVRKPL